MRRGRPGFGGLEKLLAGRYGVDPLFRFTSVVVCVLLLLSLFIRGRAAQLSAVLLGLSLGLMVWCYWRALSRRMERRRMENDRYLLLRDRVVAFFRLRRDRFRQRKDFAFFRCPGCRLLVRVPKHKGRIRITCRHCGYSFEKKT